MNDLEVRIAGAGDFRRRWLAAGAAVWPHHQPSPSPLLRPSPQIWPAPPDHVPAPPPAPAGSVPELGQRCTTDAPPMLFERRLELRTRLGAGRHGQTWRAYHHILGRDVVVKIVPRAFAGTRVVAALCREAMALDKLTHRAFPRVLECDHSEDGSWYLIEEYIDGEPLTDTFARAPLDPLTAVEIVAEIAEALSEAHTRGILHGDIKGDNLILERALPPRPRVIDLNECRLQDAFFAVTDQRYAPPPLHRLDDGATRGHPNFAAPELLRGERKSPATDVYALGVVLFILLTGERSGARAIRDIFEAGPRDEAAERLRARVIASAPELEHTFLAADLQDILAPEPERRTATMVGFLDLLRTEGDALRDLRTPTTASHAPRALAPEPAEPPPAARRTDLHAPSTPPAPAWPRWASLLTVTAAGALALSFWTSTSPAVNPEPLAVEPAPSSAPTVHEPAPPPHQILADAAPASPRPVTVSLVRAAVTERIPDLSRCPAAPPWLTLGIDIGPRVQLAQIQHAAIDPTEPFDRCVRTIVESLAFPASDYTTRHVVTLDLNPAP